MHVVVLAGIFFIMKRCTGCKIEKPIYDFSGKASSKAGIRSKCKECERKIWATKHPVHTFPTLKPLVALFIWANSMKEERFVPVNGFEDRFWISDFGRVISCNHRNGTVNFLNPHIDLSGYYQTNLRKKPANRKVRIHTLVGEYFVDKKYPTHDTVNHLLGIKLSNYYKDLEWTTRGENIKHAVATGLMDFKGEKHHNSKLTIDQVREMRKLRETQGLTYNKLGGLFGIQRRHASDVVRGINWGWLTD